MTIYVAAICGNLQGAAMRAANGERVKIYETLNEAAGGVPMHTMSHEKRLAIAAALVASVALEEGEKV